MARDKRPALERDEVFAAANQLAAEGKKVTALGLRDAVGGGGLTTIYKYLAEWEAGRPAATSAAASSEIPPGVQNALAAVWRSLAQEAAREIAEAKEQAAQEIKAAHEQFTDALASIENLEQERDLQADQIEALSKQVADLQAQFQATRDELTAQKAAAAQMQQQVKAQEAELERLHGELDKERKRNADEIQRLTRTHEVAQQQAAKEIDGLKSSLVESQNKTQQFDKDKADALGRLDQAQRQLEKVEEASKADRAERDTALKEAAQLRGLVEGLKEQVATQKTQYDELIARLNKEEKPPTKGK